MEGAIVASTGIRYGGGRVFRVLPKLIGINLLGVSFRTPREIPARILPKFIGVIRSYRCCGTSTQPDGQDGNERQPPYPAPCLTGLLGSHRTIRLAHLHRGGTTGVVCTCT